MTIVQVSGWNQGFDKVKFTLLLKSSLGCSLTRAKLMTDTIMENQTVELQVANAEVENILASMRFLGAQCGVAVYG